MSPSLLEAALAYASIGWHVFPVSPDDKKPITKHGFKDASIDASAITSWWTGAPTARIGLALRASGLLAIDYDVTETKRGNETLAKVEHAIGYLPRNLHQRSHRGGGHLIFKDPSPGDDGWTRKDGLLRGNLNKLGHGLHVDVKCNGYIVLWPSGKYRWESFRQLPDGRPDVPDLPAAWVTALKKPEREHRQRAPRQSTEDHDVAVPSEHPWLATIRKLSPDQEQVLRRDLIALPLQDSGQHSTFYAVRLVFHDFGLSLEEGWWYLVEWNTRYDDRGLYRQVLKVSEKEHPQPRGFRTQTINQEFLQWCRDPSAWRFVKQVAEAMIPASKVTPPPNKQPYAQNDEDARVEARRLYAKRYVTDLYKK